VVALKTQVSSKVDVAQHIRDSLEILGVLNNLCGRLFVHNFQQKSRINLDTAVLEKLSVIHVAS
jgi:hypothetical protein